MGGFVARKQGQGAENASAGMEYLAEIRSGLRKMRRAKGRPAGRPYTGKTQLLLKTRVARPDPETTFASWFFRAPALLPGLALLEIHR